MTCANALLQVARDNAPRLSPAAIQQLYVTLLGRGLSPATVRRATGILHVALEDAVKRGLIIRNPQDNTTPPRVPRYEPAVPTPDQVATYLADARQTATPALYGLYVTAATAGFGSESSRDFRRTQWFSSITCSASTRRSFAPVRIL